MFGDLISSSNNFSNTLVWTWANAHPYLFSLISVLKPDLVVIIVVIGVNLISKLLHGRG